MLKTLSSAKVRYDDRMHLVSLLAAEARATGNWRGYFSELIAQANLSDQFKAQAEELLTGGAKATAMRLLDWSIIKSINPEDARYMTLASILEPLLADFGLDKASTVVALMWKY